MKVDPTGFSTAALIILFHRWTNDWSPFEIATIRQLRVPRGMDKNALNVQNLLAIRTEIMRREENAQKTSVVHGQHTHHAG